MPPHDYRLALTIARNYVIMLVYSTGEERPIAIANKAITLLEQRLQANESGGAEQFSSFPRFVFY